MPAVGYEVRLTNGAEQDLETLFDYIAANRSSDDAQKLLDAILGKTGTLSRFPERGAVPRELEALGILDYRQLALPPYRLIYRVAAKKVFIFVIADGRRDMQALLERRLLGG